MKKMDRPGASGRDGRDRFVQCGRARRARRPSALFRAICCSAIAALDRVHAAVAKEKALRDRRARRHFVDAAGPGWRRVSPIRRGLEAALTRRLAGRQGDRRRR